MHRVRRQHSVRCLAVLAALGVFAPAAGAEPPAVDDPLEPMNRGILWFNDQADRFVLDPLAIGFDFVTPDPVQRSLRNAMTNARYPVHLGNNLLQGKPRAAGVETARFAVNTTVGLAGLFDPASRWGLAAHPEDFGQTLAVWGVPAGPYLVLPLFGPSSPRDGVGLAADAASSAYAYFVPWFVTAAITGTDAVNRRALVLDDLRDARTGALDYYTFVRNAYVQHRAHVIADESPETDDAIYWPEDASP